MILSRLSTALRTQNWMLLILELLIVIGGVFIGIQAANWNSDRHERGLEREYLSRILDDLNQDARSLELNIGYWEQVAAFGDTALAYAESGRASGGWPVLIAFYQASQYNPYAARSTAFSELQSSGNLRLITDAALRDALARYYDVSLSRRGALYDYNPAYRERVRGIVPIAIQRYIWADCYEFGLGAEGFVNCPSPVPEEAAAALVNQLADNEPLLEQLRFWVVNLEITLDLAESEIATTRNLVEQVSAELTE